MQKPDNRDFTDSSPPQKGEPAKKTEKLTPAQKIKELEKQNEELERRLSCPKLSFKTKEEMECMPGGRFPGSDYFGIPFYCHHFQKDKTTIDKWIKKYKIPYKGVSRKDALIDIKDFLNCLPENDWSEEDAEEEET